MPRGPGTQALVRVPMPSCTCKTSTTFPKNEHVLRILWVFCMRKSYCGVDQVLLLQVEAAGSVHSYMTYTVNVLDGRAIFKMDTGPA